MRARTGLFMGNYATAQDTVNRFNSTEMAQLGDHTGLVDGTLLELTISGGDRSAYSAAAQAAADDALAKVNAAIVDAEAEMDGYLAVRYEVPITDTVALLEACACDIARFYLYDDRAPETVATRYGNRRAWLRDVAAGKTMLGVAVEPDEAATDSPMKTHTEDDRIFTQATLADY